MPSEAEFKQLKQQVEMLQGIVDSYQRSFKAMERLAKEAVTKAIQEDDFVKNYLKKIVKELEEESLDKAREELREAVGSI